MISIKNKIYYHSPNHIVEIDTKYHSKVMHKFESIWHFSFKMNQIIFNERNHIVIFDGCSIRKIKHRMTHISRIRYSYWYYLEWLLEVITIEKITVINVFDEEKQIMELKIFDDRKLHVSPDRKKLIFQFKTKLLITDNLFDPYIYNNCKYKESNAWDLNWINNDEFVTMDYNKLFFKNITVMNVNFAMKCTFDVSKYRVGIYKKFKKTMNIAWCNKHIYIWDDNIILVLVCTTGYILQCNNLHSVQDYNFHYNVFVNAEHKMFRYRDNDLFRYRHIYDYCRDDDIPEKIKIIIEIIWELFPEDVLNIVYEQLVLQNSTSFPLNQHCLVNQNKIK